MITLIGYKTRIFNEDFLNNTFGKNFLYVDLDFLHPFLLPEAIKENMEIYGYPKKDIAFASCHGDILNIFGHLVYHKIFSPEEIKVFIAEDDCEIIESYYDNQGYLQNYPFGFFNWILDEDCIGFIKKGK